MKVFKEGDVIPFGQLNIKILGFTKKFIKTCLLDNEGIEIPMYKSRYKLRYNNCKYSYYFEVGIHNDKIYAINESEVTE
jgi:hypothetical protein